MFNVDMNNIDNTSRLIDVSYCNAY